MSQKTKDLWGQIGSADAEVKESESHLGKSECLVDEDTRNDYKNINDDKQLAPFFTKVLERRDLIDDLTTPKGTAGQKELLPE